ncbi:MAG: HupE/UreJ family protein [Runella slithyformis]|nr:MAG: HupE/UreJ family protein [Runella slithyformis]TAF95358.1 MAG: HupE/UreJ family protein [Runella sp.]TAG18747.1 MAG: HupE/UreJ family protein [Cytophagales bacterium]TAG38062.1 MAG: HupE/UreJ family protein [Cytophagia bacterium]TAG50726.1 MAG: HupE/UreJ family protein [Runella slithyformis]
MAGIKPPNPARVRPRWGNLSLAIKIILTVSLLLPHWGQRRLFAHPMPNSVVVLKIHEKHISGEIQLPLAELQSAIGMGVNEHSDRLIERLGDSLKIYLLKHIRPKSFEGKPWAVTIGKMSVIETKNELVGQYKELVVAFSMTPPLFYDLRNFYFDCDVIVREVASHSILVSVKQDWQRGIIAEDTTFQQIGVIALDVPSGKIPVFQVSLAQGSTWTGFKKMLQLGQHHIAEGTDHLLFLLVLLLPAMLTVEGKHWGQFGGTKYSLLRLLKIITAFTVGHSLTLLLAATRIVNLPIQPIEVLIAVSILVSAVHAYRPIFAGKEVWIAGGFGLIHGLAFAETLVDLQLDLKQLLLSILGFNLGIELMQLFIVALIIPWLILLSRTRFYAPFRTVSAILISIAALGWVVERVMGQPNFVSTIINLLSLTPF